jgi:hypothetical protein
MTKLDSIEGAGALVPPAYLLSFIVEQLKQINAEHALNEKRRKICRREFWLLIRRSHGKKPYYKRLYKSAYDKVAAHIDQQNHNVNHQRVDDSVTDLIKETLGTDEKLNGVHSVTENTNVNHGMPSNTSPSLQLRYKSDIDTTNHEFCEGDEMIRKNCAGVASIKC